MVKGVGVRRPGGEEWEEGATVDRADRSWSERAAEAVGHLYAFFAKVRVLGRPPLPFQSKPYKKNNEKSKYDISLKID